ncbi:MAG: tyrosine-type recombinase/integrase, partial [Sedimentisphaerales bacterium]|nr:tyrosine-type recombinase/integrase [Sedimentisphaerales bacterium]
DVASSSYLMYNILSESKGFFNSPPDTFNSPFTELSNYVVTLPDGQELLFTNRFPEKRWKKTRCKIGLPDLKFHDLRKTFASLLAQRGVSTAVTQRLLEHSSPKLTNDVYTNVDPALRQAINLLPMAELF